MGAHRQVRRHGAHEHNRPTSKTVRKRRHRTKYMLHHLDGLCRLGQHIAVPCSYAGRCSAGGDSDMFATRPGLMHLASPAFQVFLVLRYHGHLRQPFWHGECVTRWPRTSSKTKPPHTANYLNSNMRAGQPLAVHVRLSAPTEAPKEAPTEGPAP